ncbi:MAG: hypothetical protein IKH28_05335 [Lachnospiraceae bacterium]|nr:hypothetical protein [Lachnospiraceae bacterium]
MRKLKKTEKIESTKAEKAQKSQISEKWQKIKNTAEISKKVSHYSKVLLGE